MNPLVTFPDPEEAVTLYYRGLGITDTAGTTFPGAELAKGVKHLQVELENGGTEDYPATERAQIRVTCHMGPGQRAAVKALASLAQGHLYAHPGDGTILATQPLVGRSDVITDPDTRNLMVWFTFRVSLKATQLAS